VTPTDTAHDLDDRILDATRACLERWGVARFTIADVCATAGVSRATVYRAFPGGRETLLEALRVRELATFLTTVRLHTDGAADLEDLIVRCMTVATSELRHDAHLATMLAAAPGEVATQLTVAGVPRIVRLATEYFTPLLEQFVARGRALELVELLVRVVISYFLSPSPRYDFARAQDAREFVRLHVLGTSHHDTAQTAHTSLIDKEQP
jgi:AcrR family transcriptional regulator